jgi:hypothetical protein
MLLNVIKGTGKYAKLAMKCDECVCEYIGRRHTVEKQGDFNRCNSCTRRNNLKTARLNGNFGDKISKGKKGKLFTEAHKQALRGRVTSEETKLRMSGSAKKRQRSFAKYRLCLFECDKCHKYCQLKTKTILKLYNLYKEIYCRNCYQSITGKKTAAKMSAIYSKWYSGAGNFCHKPGVAEKISKARTGVPLTDAHRKALSIPKSKCDKIREAANRPEERERRSKLMCDRMKNGYSIDKAYGINTVVKIGKSVKEILCRSNLEKSFLEKVDICSKIISIESAEYLKIPYVLNGSSHLYLPDFKIVTQEGQIIFVEIKPFAWANNEETLVKKKVLDIYCADHNYLSVLLTERSMHIWLEQYK